MQYGNAAFRRETTLNFLLEAITRGRIEELLNGFRRCFEPNVGGRSIPDIVHNEIKCDGFTSSLVGHDFCGNYG